MRGRTNATGSGSIYAMRNLCAETATCVRRCVFAVLFPIYIYIEPIISMSNPDAKEKKRAGRGTSRLVCSILSNKSDLLLS
eukprot:gene5873-4193_t